MLPAYNSIRAISAPAGSGVVGTGFRTLVWAVLSNIRGVMARVRSGRTWMETFFRNQEMADDVLRMTPRQRVAFAAACAERSLRWIDASAVRCGEPASSAPFHEAIAILWAHVSGTPVLTRLRKCERSVRQTIADPDVAAEGAHPASTSVLHALRCATRGGDTQAALSAAWEAFNASRQGCALTRGRAVAIDVADELERGSKTLQREIDFQIAALAVAQDLAIPRQEDFRGSARRRSV